jgi:hypothetical protein
MGHETRTLKQRELPNLSHHFLKIGGMLVDEKQPKNVYGIIPGQGGRIEVLPRPQTKGQKRLSSIEVLLELEKRELKNDAEEISQYNAGVAALLGGLAMREFNNLVVEKHYPLTEMALGGLSRHVRVLHSNIGEAVEGMMDPKNLAIRMDKIGRLLYQERARPIFKQSMFGIIEQS